MNKLFAILIAALFCLTLTVPALAEEEIYHVGICQLVQHSALDNAAKGFKDALSGLLGDRVVFHEQNASGDVGTCIAVVNSLIAEEVDLIVANSTPALQAAHVSTGEIPILGVSITDYAAALDYDTWNGVTGINISGTSDLAPLDGQTGLIAEMFPEADEVGLLYCSSEANAIYQIGIMKDYLTEMGYACTEYAFTDTNDVTPVAQTACAASDVVFVATDNTVAACAEAVRNAVEIERTAIIGGDEGICFGCGVATICANYYDLGYTTGEMAYEVLVNGADVADMPIRFASEFSKVYNPEMAEYLGIAAPEGYTPIGG